MPQTALESAPHGQHPPEPEVRGEEGRAACLTGQVYELRVGLKLSYVASKKYISIQKIPKKLATLLVLCF